MRKFAILLALTLGFVTFPACNDGGSGNGITGPSDRFLGYDESEFFWQENSTEFLHVNVYPRKPAPDEGCQWGHWGSGVHYDSGESGQDYRISELNRFITPDSGRIDLVCRDKGVEFTCKGIVPICPFVCESCQPAGCTNCPVAKPKATPKATPKPTPKPTPPPPCGSCGTPTPTPCGGCGTPTPTPTPSCPSVTISSFPFSATVGAGQSLVINYSTSGAEQCVISGEGWTSGGGLPPSGSYTTPPLTISQTIAMVCNCGGNTAQTFCAVAVQ